MHFYRRCLSYFRDDLGKIILNYVLIGVGTLLGLLQAFPLAILIDAIIADKESDRWIDRVFFWWVQDYDKTTQIILLAAAILALVLASEVLRTIQTLLNILVGYNGLLRVRCELFRKLQILSLAYHKSQPQGDAIYRLTWDTFGFQTILNVIAGIFLNLITLIVMVVIMLGMNWKLTLVSLAIVPFLLATIRWYGKVLQDRATEAKEFDASVTTAIQRSVSTIGLVQAFGREADEYRNFESTILSTVRAYLRLHWHEVMYWLVLGVIFGIGGAVIFGYGGVLVLRGTMEAGSLIIFLDYMRRLYDPLNKLSATGASIAAGVAGAKRVFEVLDRDPVIKDRPNALHLPRKPRTLRLEDVSFEYRPGEPVLKNINVTIPPGQMVAFVGSSGVGKTTLLNLLPRFYDPTSGAMRLDDIDVRDIKLADLRRHIALVLQETVILPTTVAENIAYGEPGASDAKIKRAAELAGAAAFIEKLPKGYEEVISEQGSNLSGGQKQRISIARALLTEAPIVIMDEPTSALDPQHEQHIIETLKRLKGQRTFVLVSHRLSTVADCDQIFVMDEGRIVEQGTHDQLVKQRGLYWKMAKHQMKLEDESTNPHESSQISLNHG
jgi:ABC-type multidrug transport system fused ATPase/permease subunit